MDPGTGPRLSAPAGGASPRGCAACAVVTPAGVNCERDRPVICERAGSKQKAALLHEINRMLCTFLLVALSSQKLNIFVGVGAAKSERNDVIHMVISAKWLFTAGAFSLLQLKQLNGDSRC